MKQPRWLQSAYFAFLRANNKLVLEVAVGLLFIVLGIYFIRHEGVEMTHVAESLRRANSIWVATGLLMMLLFVIVQGLMYQFSFRAIHEKIRLSTAVSLFLKRNVVSVFLPAGMLTNMLFFSKEVEKREGVSRTQIYFASSIFTICSIASTIIVGIPALILLFLKDSLSGKIVFGLVASVLLLAVLGYAVYNIVKEGFLYHFLEKRLPSIFQTIRQLKDQAFNRYDFYAVILLSCVIEMIGITHLYISIKAMGGAATWEMAVVGYGIVLMLLMSAPFLRGIGVIEVALTYALTLFGFTTIAAISIAFLFRFFEFWTVLILGLVALVGQKDNAIVRLFPSVLLLVLGLVNIFSAITPALPQRFSMLQTFLPLAAINASNYLVLLSGIIMLAVAVYLVRGLRSAWVMAIILCAVSLVAHLTKGIDWEEASVACITLISLIYQRDQYFVRPDLRLVRRSWLPAVIAVAAVWLLGTVAFYFLDAQHFRANFTLWQSFQETVTTFFLLNVDLAPATPFGHEFLAGMNILGACTMILVAFVLLRPRVQRSDAGAADRQKAKALVEKYGKSSLDYFKTYADKKFWFASDGDSFVAFKTSRKYAIVLENPVGPNDMAISQAIVEFDTFCRQNGLRSAYYRVPQAQLPVYQALNKHTMPIGDEAISQLDTFTTEGKEKKSMRNTMNKMTKEGYTFHVHKPPQMDGFVQQLKAASDDWLYDMDRTELLFSQGCFDETELKSQTVLTLQSPEGKVVGFVNLIPDYTKGEANFDLMRKTADAPNGTMDFLFVRMFEYLKGQGYQCCNLGMVPMSGIEKPENLQEQVIKLAYEHIKRFGHYKSLHNFKEKFNPEWTMMYFVYTAPIDLVELPAALEQVIQP